MCSFDEQVNDFLFERLGIKVDSKRNWGGRRSGCNRKINIDDNIGEIK